MEGVDAKSQRGKKRKAERMAEKSENSQVKPWGTTGPPPSEWREVT